LILLISASQVARIIGVEPSAPDFVKNDLYLVEVSNYFPNEVTEVTFSPG
jgi:hypothetical protein